MRSGSSFHSGGMANGCLSKKPIFYAVYNSLYLLYGFKLEQHPIACESGDPQIQPHSNDGEVKLQYMPAIFRTAMDGIS